MAEKKVESKWGYVLLGLLIACVIIGFVFGRASGRRNLAHQICQELGAEKAEMVDGQIYCRNGVYLRPLTALITETEEE